MNHPHAPRRLVIATRESALALWQAEHVRTRLEALYPSSAIELLGVTTQGDRIVDRALAAVGGKGLFVKELELAMSEGRADLAVHSLKDVPMELPDEFTLAAIVAREDPRDAFVSNRYAALEGLPAGAIIGTSSLRREAQLRERYPKVKVEPLRGNVNTRLRKLDAGHYCGDRIRALLEPDDSLPAPGQGALALECRADRNDVIAALSPLSDPGTVLATTAERAFSRALSGSCTTPLAAYAQWEEGRLWIRGYLARRDGTDSLRGEREAEVADGEEAEALGQGLADEFLARGAARLVLTSP